MFANRLRSRAFWKIFVQTHFQGFSDILSSLQPIDFLHKNPCQNYDENHFETKYANGILPERQNPLLRLFLRLPGSGFLAAFLD